MCALAVVLWEIATQGEHSAHAAACPLQPCCGTRGRRCGEVRCTRAALALRPTTKATCPSPLILHRPLSSLPLVPRAVGGAHPRRVLT